MGIIKVLIVYTNIWKFILSAGTEKIIPGNDKLRRKVFAQIMLRFLSG